MRRPTLALSLLLAAACTPAPTTGSPAGLPKAEIAALQGTERYPIMVGTGETTQFRGQLRVARLEAKGFHTKAAGDGSDVALLLDAAEILDPDLAEQIADPAPVKAEQLEAFLDNEWDDFQGGKDDPGRQSAEFLKLIREKGLNAGDFLALHQQLRMPLKDTMAFLAMCDALGSRRGTSGADVLDELLVSLDTFRLSPGDFVRIVNEAGQSVGGFLQRLDSRQEGLSAFLEAAAKGGGTLQDAIRNASGMSVQKALSIRISRPFFYTPRIDTVEQNVVTGNVGFVTSESAHSPDGYPAGTAVKAPKRWLIIGDPANPLAKAEWHLTYRSQIRKPGFAGKYLTGIGGEYPTLQSQLGWYLNAAVKVSHVTFVGFLTDPEAEALIHHRMIANLTFDTAYLWEEAYTVRAGSQEPSTAKHVVAHEHRWTPFTNAVSFLMSE